MPLNNTYCPGGTPDRSLARSAWESAPRKIRPVGYGTIGRSLPEAFLIGFLISWATSRIRRRPLVGFSIAAFQTCGLRNGLLGFNLKFERL